MRGVRCITTGSIETALRMSSDSAATLLSQRLPRQRNRNPFLFPANDRISTGRVNTTAGNNSAPEERVICVGALIVQTALESVSGS